MKYQFLGRTGLKVSTVGFGGIPIQKVSHKEAIHVIRRCYELGINYFDTARAYNIYKFSSEELIGEALKDVRDNIFLATKSKSRTKDGILKELKISLANLRTDWVDLYQLHMVNSKDEWEQIKASKGALEALYKACDQGIIHHIGISSHDLSLLTEIVKENVFETIMVAFNYIATQPKDDLFPSCHQMNVGTIIMKPFAGGALSNAKTALKFILNNENVDLVIPGMDSVSVVEENVTVVSGSYKLSSEEYDIIQKDKDTLGNQFCRFCNYCQPCQQTIPISFVLGIESYIKRQGVTSQFKEKFQEVKEKVPRCIECGECEIRCPYKLPIRKLLPQRVEFGKKILKSGNF